MTRHRCVQSLLARAIHDECFAEVVNGGAAKLLANARENRFPIFAFLRTCADLDELMGVQSAIDLLEHGSGQALIANQHNWL